MKKENSNEQYLHKIMETITTHPDFGKKNPFDIGTECGYSEDDVEKLLQMASEQIGSKFSKEQDTFYFLLEIPQNQFDKTVWVVSINIYDWAPKLLHKLPECESLTNLPFHIKNNILTWFYIIRKFSDSNSPIILNRENLKTGEISTIKICSETDSGAFNSRARVLNLESGNTLVLINDECFLCNETQVIKKAKLSLLPYRKYYIGQATEDLQLFEYSSHIYLLKDNCLYLIDDSLQAHTIWNCLKNGDERFIYAIEYENGSLVWYTNDGRKNYFNPDGSISYISYTNQIPSGRPDFRTIVSTKDYKALPGSLVNKDNKKFWLLGCNFVSQLVGIYNKNIFLGIAAKTDYSLSEHNDFYGIIKIDLQTEKVPTIIIPKPLEFSEKDEKGEDTYSIYM